MDTSESPKQQAVDALITQMNNLRSGSKYLPLLKPAQLKIGETHDATTIRKVKSKFGPSYVLESTNFQLFLPKRFSNINITEKVEGRKFKIIGFNKTSSGHYTPAFEFLHQK